MRFTWALLILLVLTPLTAQAQSKTKKSRKAPAAETITGCVDERSAQFLLRTDDMLKELAILEAVGFDNTNFARFVGHKVAATGQLVKGEGTPTLRITSLDRIKNISDICTPPADGPVTK
jgi:hypothetical protein